MICHAICAMGMTNIKAHHLQREITNWIRMNYRAVQPDTVQREFRRMCQSPNHDIVKTREGKFVRYEIRRLFDLRFDKEQGTLF